MDDAAPTFYRAHMGRQNPPTAPFKEAALVIGRRGGKSRMLALIAIYLACFRDSAPHLAPGEVPSVAILAADRRQARSIFRYMTGMLHAAPLRTSGARGQLSGISGRRITISRRHHERP